MTKFITLVLFVLPLSLLANPLVGDKKIYLVSAGDELTQIATVTFSQTDQGVEHTVKLLDAPFENQFLSMRPFQCLMGAKQVMCHVPYPYEKADLVKSNDLTDLSYDLLFLHKSPAEYGINLWNGIFYKLAVEGDQIVGLVHEVDMNIIASPPETEELPFTEDQVFEGDPVNYVYPKLLIK